MLATAQLDEAGGQRRAGRGQHPRRSREPKVQHLGLDPGRDEDVAGFDIPVDDPGGVCGVERLRNLNRPFEQLLESDLPSHGRLAEGRPSSSSIVKKSSPSCSPMS